MIKFACAQIEIIAGRPDLNTKKILETILSAKKTNIDILIFPEMSIPGYLLGDLWEQTAFLEDCESFGQQIIAATTNIAVIFGNVALDHNKVNEDGRIRKYNAAFVAQNGALIAGYGDYPFVIKNSLPNYRVFDDSRYFYSLNKLLSESIITLEETVRPIKIQIRDTMINLGLFLCEDGWTENYFTNIPNLLAKNGADILCNISSSPFTLKKNDKRHHIFSEQAKTNKLPLLYCNNVGVQNNGKNVFTYDGCSCVYNNCGELLTTAKSFNEELLTFTLTPNTKNINITSSPHILSEEPSEIYNALKYGAQKFLQQMNIKKMVIGLSGGIDSAVTAAFYANILGPENILLVNMPSQYNSQLTQNLAQTMAAALKTNYLIMPIQETVDFTIKQITTTSVHNYANNTDFNLILTPLATENIQARDRGARIIAGLSAAFNGAFSCNANKAELSVGYATFYGDIAGCLALIGDLWKHQVYALGHYLNNEIFKKEVIPETVFNITPSAELSSIQTVGTGGDPLTYTYHDYLFKAFIENWSKISPAEILEWYINNTLESKLGCEKAIVHKLFSTDALFIADLEHWWNLFCGFAVAKRIQAPPILSITKRSYGYDHREAQLSPYFSIKYLELKKQLLAKN